MRLLADENIPLASIRALRAAGHDVLAASEAIPHTLDRDVLARAGAEERLLVRFDRDFGALAFKGEVSVPAGILLLRFVPLTPEEPATVLLDLLSDPSLTFSGRFTVIDRERVPQRCKARARVASGGLLWTRRGGNRSSPSAQPVRVRVPDEVLVTALVPLEAIGEALGGSGDAR